ncbi:MAG: winged helix DNA-binding protein, partial [Sphingomonas sp.]|nr:winged helix DNA-binding protein [Sphingomonas sp.]
GGGAASERASDGEASGAAAIREMIRSRRLRDDLFGAGLFADPAWDILLDLSAAKIEGRSVAVSSLCIAAAVPATTALRWIKQLTEAGLLRRVADPFDGRRIFIELTDAAAAAMMSYFAATSNGARG